MKEISFTPDEQLLLSFALQPYQPNISSCIDRLMAYPFLNDLKLKSKSYYRKFLKDFSTKNYLLWNKVRNVSIEHERLSICIYRVRRSSIRYKENVYCDARLFPYENGLVEIKEDKSYGNGINVFTRGGDFICTAYPNKSIKVEPIKPLRRNTSKFFQDKPGAKK